MSSGSDDAYDDDHDEIEAIIKTAFKSVLYLSRQCGRLNPSAQARIAGDCSECRKLLKAAERDSDAAERLAENAHAYLRHVKSLPPHTCCSDTDAHA